MKKIFKLFFYSGILLLFFIVAFIFAAQRNQMETYNDYVFVLGARANSGKLSKTLINRLDTAYEYLEKHKDSKAVLCGGKENPEDESQAKYMEIYLIKKGISKDRLILEGKSVNTFENIKLGLLKLDKKPLNITIVTSDYHLFRSKLIASRFGVNANTVPAKTPNGAILKDYPREVFAVIKTFLFDKPTEQDLKKLHNLGSKSENLLLFIFSKFF